MKILIIDDSDYKITSLRSAIESLMPSAETKVAKSFQTGIRSIAAFSPDVILLDMTLPTSETEDGRLEGRIRIYGGRDILAEMEFNNHESHVIIVTQFDHFGEPPNAMDHKTLFDQLRYDFPNLMLGGIYYSNIDSRWREELAKLLQQVKS